MLWLCHPVCCTVRSDWWWPEGKEPLVQIFLQAFPYFTRGSRHEDWSSGLAVCSSTLLMTAPPSLPKAHLWIGPTVPWCKFSFGAYPPLSSLDSAGLFTTWGDQRGWDGWLGTTSGGNVVPGWQHLAGWQAGRRGPDAAQVGCCQIGAWWESSWPRG